MSAPDLKQIENLMDDEIMTPSAVARILGCSAQAVRRHIKAGLVPSVQIMGKWYMTGEGVKKIVKINQPL
jgi:predicted site-specific integrase-resolvase